MNKILKIILGLILVLVPLYLIFPGMPLSSFGVSALELVKGGATILILIIGIVLIFFGINELKD